MATKPNIAPRAVKLERQREKSKNLVFSLGKGFRVLEAFNNRDRELTLTEIAVRAGLDPGTTFRLVKTLVALGYLHQAAGVKRYYLGFKVLDLGFNAIARMELHETSRPILRSLVGEVREAASIGTLDGGEVVYIERVQAGLARLGVDIRIGSRLPAYCTAIGHSILAYLPRQERLRILEMRPRVKYTDRTLVTVAEIEARLQRVRTMGYALSDQETVPGLRVIAAPILDPDGHPYGGVSIAAPSISSTLEEFVRSSKEPLLRAAVDLARLMRMAGSVAVAAGPTDLHAG